MATVVASTKGPINIPVKRSWESGLNILLLVAACVDLFTPILIWKGVLPSAVRWASQAAIMVMILGCITRMIVFNHIPRGILMMAAVAVVWGADAVLRGQGIVTTVWGLWLLFQYPFVAMFLYLQPGWPDHFPGLFRKLALGYLGLEVAIQCLEYLMGWVPGDSLSGTLGAHGTGDLLIFIFFVICLFLGQWIVSKRWGYLLVATGLGAISSVLGEMKLFTVGLLLIGFLALAIYVIKYRNPLVGVLYTFFIIVALVTFGLLYNLIVPGADKTPIQTYITNPQVLYDYLNLEKRRYGNGNYYTDLGRGAALGVGWQSLQGDPVTMLFGWGIGARSESVTLGTSGLGIQQGDLGQTSGTGLLIKMQEMGAVGLAALAAFFLWIIFRMFADIRRNPSSAATSLRYAVAIFTICWPAWLWYNNAWILRVAMIFYWTALGYILSEAANFPIGQKIKR